jgi:hypothetical protein
MPIPGDPTIVVSPGAYNLALERLVANFEPNLDSQRLALLEREYQRVFKPVEYDPVGGLKDYLLEQTVDRLIDRRPERGMPRVAEIRAVLDPLVDAEWSLRRGREVVEREKRLEGERSRG